MVITVANEKELSLVEMSYAEGQRLTAKREPFNEELMNFRANEDMEYLISNIMKGLEVIKGVKFKSCTVERKRDVYQFKKNNEDLTKEELEELNRITSANKGVRKSVKSAYPLTPIKQSRLLTCNVVMEFSDEEQTIDYNFKFFYPELIKKQYFLINGNKFFPVLQLSDAEFYRSGKNTIVFKTTFMPINITANKNVLIDSIGNEIGKCRNFDVALFGKHINAMLYFFAEYGVYETARLFGLGDHIEFVFKKMETHMAQEGIKKNDRDELDYYMFKLAPSLTLKVKKDFFSQETNMKEKMKMGILHTFITSFKKKHIDENSFYSDEYWKRQLGKQITNNTTKMYEKATSMLSSLERILDVTTKDMMRIKDEYKDEIYSVIKYMIENFESIILINTHDLANKRIRCGEYLINPITTRQSPSVYRLISPAKKVTVDNNKQIFSSINEDYLINQITTINLVRYSNQVNPAFNLFTNILKQSNSGPQSQKTDSGSNSISNRGMDPSYIGRIDVISTSSGEPGISGTLTPFCKICDPNNNGNFYFTNESNILDLNAHTEKDIEEYRDEVESEEIDIVA